jgi:hypothetical protein
MSSDAGTQQQSVADALARLVEARRGAESVWVEALRELGAVDRAVYEAVADTPTPELDGPVRRLSNAASYSRLWLGVAAALAVLGGRRGRRAALEGVLAIGVTSATVNLGMKPLAQRRRPDPIPSRPATRRRRSRSPTRSAGTCRSWPCRSGCWRAASPIRAFTSACITRVTW